MNFAARLPMLLAVSFLVTALGADSALASQEQSGVLLNDEEIAKVVRHGPWPPKKQIDESNRVANNPLAIEFGKLL